MNNPIPPIDPQALQAILSRHLAMYRSKVPHYQALMLNGLRAMWHEPHESLLDIGGGTGVIAQAIAELFPVKRVYAIDVVDRYCPTLTVETGTYDGEKLPFGDVAFAAATLNNVLHHVPKAARGGLIREIRRVVAGPVYIKDHVSHGWLDDRRLGALDAIGNIPFGGMVVAEYLKQSEWDALAEQGGYAIGAMVPAISYRSAPYTLLFPNRLEISMRLDPR